MSIGFAYTLEAMASQSLGEKVTKYFLKKYLIYIRIFLFIWMANLCNGYYQLYSRTSEINRLMQGGSSSQVEVKSKTTVYLSLEVLTMTIVFQLSQGIILGFLRTQEPIYRRIIGREVKSWFGIITNYKEGEVKNANELLN